MDLETRIRLTEELLVDLKAELKEQGRQAEAARDAGLDDLANAATSALEALKVRAEGISPALAQRALDEVLARSGVSAFSPISFRKEN